MTTLSVPDMSCAHCKATVERAIASAAPGAATTVDLAAHKVTTDATNLAAVLAALAAQGYPATVSAA